MLVKSTPIPLVFLTEPSQDQRGNLGVPMDVSSPITSDEEYLSPLEEGMDFSSYRGPEPRKIVDTRFKEPPSFQVSENNKIFFKNTSLSTYTYTLISKQGRFTFYSRKDMIAVIAISMWTCNPHNPNNLKHDHSYSFLETLRYSYNFWKNLCA